jgi:hypothetical protein
MRLTFKIINHGKFLDFATPSCCHLLPVLFSRDDLNSRMFVLQPILASVLLDGAQESLPSQYMDKDL